MTVVAHPLNIIMDSKTNLIYLAAGFRPATHWEENLQHSPAIRASERVLKKVGQKRGGEKE